MNDGEQTGGAIERWASTAAVAIVAVTCLLILRPFITAALWGAILCFSTWPLFTRFTAELGGRRTLAALLATLLLSAIFIAPVAILVSRITANTTEIIEASRKLIHGVRLRLRPGSLQSRFWVLALRPVGAC